MNGTKKEPRIPNKEFKELLEKAKGRITRCSGDYTASGGRLSKNFRWINLFGACHAWTNDLQPDDKLVYCIIPGDHWGMDCAQHFLEWLFDPDRSFYSQLLRYYRKDFCVLKQDGLIRGFYIKNYHRYTHNHKVLHGLFKATRICNENGKRQRLDTFYRKWAMEEKYDPIIVWPLCFYFNGSNKSKIGHCSFDEPEFDLSRMVDINHNHWDLRESEGKYVGEGKYAIGRGFNPFKHIINGEYKPLKSRFYTKYNKKNVENFTDEVFHEFFKEWNTEKYKEYNKCAD